MFKCPQCGYVFENYVQFCPCCGLRIVLADNPAPKKVHLARKIVSMALSIGAFVFAIICSLYTFIFSIVDGDVGIALSIVYSFMAVPPAIVGLVMSVGNIRNGDRSVFSRLGKIFGMITPIIMGASIFFALAIALA